MALSRMQDSLAVRLLRHAGRNEFGLLQIKRWPATQQPVGHRPQDEAPR
jgi:hypothetical protein